MSCITCGLSTTSGQFCVGCGQPLAGESAPPVTSVTVEERPPPRSTWLSFQEIRLLACPKCGAPNSAARWRCARCGEAFDERADDDSSIDLTPPPATPGVDSPEAAPWLALITVAVGIAAVAVAIAMLASRGIGPFATEESASPSAQLIKADVVSVGASSNAQRARAALVNDGDPTTAWRATADDAEPWIELRLEEPVQVDHLLVWNGDQSTGEAWNATPKVRDVFLLFPDVGKRYKASFHNSTSEFRVDIENPPVSRRIRILVASTFGDGPGTSLSEVEAFVSGSTTAAD